MTKKTKDYYAEEIQKTARTQNTYDEVMGSLTKCPFCDLKSKYFIKEGTYCALTVNLFPYIDGHLEVIPKRHVERFEDLTDAEFAETFDLIKLGKKKLAGFLGTTSFNILFREGPKSGASLGHVHFHIIPMDQSVLLSNVVPVKFAPIEMAEKLRLHENEQVYTAADVKNMREACWMCDASMCQVKTGCVAVNADKVIVKSCNKLLSADDSVPERDRAQHAEDALIQEAKKKKLSLKGAYVYATRFPCMACAKKLIKQKVSKVYYMSDLFTSGNVAMPLFVENHIPVVQIAEKAVWKDYK
jgi:diadenosine tetraphosphate (Ap4A) HIT family hydrolase/pyrimidine deaminase RibD-like protein